MKGILGKKIGMTRVIQDDGRVIPITVVACEPNEVAQVKTVEKDGYPALVLGFGKLTKPTKTRKFRMLREFRLEEGQQANLGDTVTLEIFTEGDKIQISSVSKGKGFQGVMKRWNMHGGPGGHGSHFKREPGSVGARAKPGKIHRGKHMAGRMGGDKISLKSSVVYLDKKKNLIGVAGPVAGPNNSYVSIKKLS